MVRRIGGDLGGNILRDALEDSIRVGEEGAELVVEGFEDVAQALHLGICLAAAAADGHGADDSVFVREEDGHGCLLLHAVAVHVNGLQNAFCQVLFLGGGELCDEEVQED